MIKCRRKLHEGWVVDESEFYGRHSAVLEFQCKWCPAVLESSKTAIRQYYIFFKGYLRL